MEADTRDIFSKCFGNNGLFKDLADQDNNYFAQPILEGAIGPHMIFQGKKMLVWSINDYLGLANNPTIRTSALHSLEEHGPSSPMGSRLLTGNTIKHLELEEALAQFVHKEKSLLFSYGYLGVLGVISSLVHKQDTIIVDHNSHASIIDGARLVRSDKRRFRVFRHNDMNHLEQILQEVNRDRKGGILIVTDGVFGMSGELSPLDKICDLKEKYGARLLVDDAHGFGVMGMTGRGTGEFFNVQNKIDLYFSTFAKAFASIGGFVAGDKDIINFIKWNARPLIFAKSLPLVYVSSLKTALEIIKNESDRRTNLWKVSRQLQNGCKQMGLDTGKTQSPITPLFFRCDHEQELGKVIYYLREIQNIFVSGVMYPVIPRGQFMLRLVPTALHNEQDVQKTLVAFEEYLNQADRYA